MKTTPFTEKHISLGAKMHEFAGYNMPIEYSGIIDEHLTVCQGVGVFDVSHMGEFWVKGPHALDFLQKVTSNNVAALTPGKVQYTCFPNDNGGIVDDLLVYHYEPEKYLLVVNASNIEKDWYWCVSHNFRPHGTACCARTEGYSDVAETDFHQSFRPSLLYFYPR